ncbi:MAG: TIGR02452 family protein, partial [Eubacterium sp.]|nr:TIGR02452 family protein [Eubacterium sp.]
YITGKNMSREDNITIFEDTKEFYETNDRLQESINKSVSGQKMIPESEWMDMDIVTCAAPNLREHPSNMMNPHAGSAPGTLSDNELMDIHMTRARRILDSAAAHQCDVVILGAFGCGAFCNDPRIVAEAYRRVIGDYDGVFDAIEFAVYCTPRDRRNYDAFDKVM